MQVARLFPCTGYVRALESVRKNTIEAVRSLVLRTTITLAAAGAAVILLLISPETAHAGPNGERYAAIAIDGNTGEVVFARNADDLRYPASTTKIMTLYLMFEAIEAGRFTLDSKLPVSAYAAARPPSKIGVRAGQTIRVEDAILALVTKSANDVSVVIAEAIAGSVGEFAKQMTARAQSIGMSSSVFLNPHGLPNSGQVTTARDLATLGRSIQWRFPEYYKYFATRNFNYRGTNYRNHNRLLGRVAGVDGIKTGFIRASGFNLVANMIRNNRHVVAVVMGGRSGGSRNAEMERILALAYDRVGRFETPIAQTTPRALALAMMQLPRPNPMAPTVVATVPGATQIQNDRGPVQMLVDPASGELQIARAASVSQPIVAAPAAVQQPAEQVGQFGSIDELTRSIAMNQPVQIDILSPANAPVLAQAAPAAEAGPQSIDDLVTASVSTTVIQTPSRIMTSDGTVIEPNIPAAQTAAVQQAAALPPAQQTVAQQPATQVDTPTAPPPSGWFIQIGAYNDEQSALNRMQTARQIADHLLNQAAPYTETVDKDGQTLWRARFAGMDQADARAACDFLINKDFGCFAQQL